MDLTGVFLEEIRHPRFPRDFRVYDGNPDEDGEPLHPLDRMRLDLAVDVLHDIEEEDSAQAEMMSLGRLLVPCLKYRGSGRHIVVEPWTREDLEGETLYSDTRTRLARDLSREQAIQDLLVRGSELPPKGLHAQTFWTAQTELPEVRFAHEDPQLSAFASALYNHLVRDSKVELENVRGRVDRLHAEGFKSLGLSHRPRDAMRLYKKLLALSMKCVSLLCGAVALRFVERQLEAFADPQSPPVLSAEELELLNFRYGALPEFGMINVAFFAGFGEETFARVNDLFKTYATAAPLLQRQEAADRLYRWMYLVSAYRSRRKVARTDEKRNARRLRTARRDTRAVESEADRRALNPYQVSAAREEISDNLKNLLDRLKPRDARLVRALVVAGGDRAEAASRCGLNREQFNRRFRQTVRPKINKFIADGNSSTIRNISI